MGIKNQFKLILGASVLIVAFQNCERDVQFQGSEKMASNASGNGEGYSGKPDKFRHYDLAQPCMQLDRNSKPLPNSEIFLRGAPAAKSPFLVRDNCQDLTPQALLASDVQFTSNVEDSLVYRGKAYSSKNPPGDFDVVASRCPTGKALIPGAARKNMIISAQDWSLKASATQGWFIHPGIGVSLDSSIVSLPSYKIERNSATELEEFRRASQHIALAPSTAYVYSFIASPGTRDGVAFRFFRDDNSVSLQESITINLNVRSGTSNVVLNSSNPPVQVTMVPVANGYFCSIYFTTTANTNSYLSDIGISPQNGSNVGAVGDSILASTAQLERVDDFCQ